MRSVGLAVILLGVLLLVFPFFRHWMPYIRVATEDARILGGCLLAVGALTLAVFRNQS